MAEHKCNKCDKNAKMLLTYGPHRFCEQHFLEFFEKRVRKTLRKYGLVKRGEKLAVGVSGGKDSVTVLYMLNKILGKGNEITAVLIDEGIPGYRDKALKVAEKNCSEIGVQYETFSFKEMYGTTNSEIMKKIAGNKELGSSCAFCGVLRRNALNAAALKLKADKLVTGHNLDDEVQSILMNFFENDWKRMVRLGAVAGGSKSKEFVPRIKPLYETPEQEIVAFVNFTGLKVYSEECCPFSWQAKRNEFRTMLDKMETKFPGTKYSILQSFKTIKPKLSVSDFAGELKKCGKCGNPTSGEICRVCIQLEKIK